jgi:hypothetical protein
MAGVKNLEELAHPDYWDQRYRKNANNELFEWLKPFKSIEPLLSAHLPKPVAAEDGGPQQQKQPRILHLGCGNSVGSFLFFSSFLSSLVWLPGLEAWDQVGKTRYCWLTARLVAADGFV